MAVEQAKFQTLANKLLADTFGDFARTLTLKETVEAQYPDPVTEIEQSGQATRIESQSSKFDAEQIQVGDIVVITEYQQWTTVKPRTDLTSVVFDGIPCQILDYEADPANATYQIQLRPK